MRTFQRIARLIRPSIGLPLLAGFALLGLVLLSLGCNEEGGRAATAAPAVNPRLPDVPVPAGFVFKANESQERQARGFRFVRHSYKGDATVRQVTDFYREYMPRMGWRLLEESLVRGRQRLMFEKGSDTCHVSIWDDWGTHVLIQVMPSGGRPSANPTAGPTGSPS